MSVAELLRRRRAVQRHETALRANDSLFDVARGLRRLAQEQINDGRPDLAQPYIEEAEMFESAIQTPKGL